MKSIVLVALVACGNHPSSSIPQGKPSPIRLVRCAAAIPPPHAKADEAVPAVNDRQSWSVSNKRDRIVVGNRAQVTLGTVNVRSGPISADEVAVSVRTKLGDFKACYAAESTAISKAATSYRLTIGPDGVVVVVDSTAPSMSSSLDSCVRRVFRSTRFLLKSGSSTVQIPLVFDSTGAFAVPKPLDDAQPAEPWTPFAVGTTPPNPAAIGAARATEAMVRTKLADLDKCFAPAIAGSMRILLEIDIAGDLGGIRPGGFGDRDGELCAAKVLRGTRVMTPLQEHVEVACDFARGDAQPWRIAPAAYKVIDIERTQLKYAADTLIPGVTDPQPLPADTYVVLARTDTLGAMLQLALMWARDANAVVFAVADGKLAPLFLGMGNAASDADGSDALRPAVRVGGKAAIGCIGKASHKANVSSSTELGGLMQRLAARCRTLHCTPTLVVAIDSDAVVRDLLEVAGAARRAGFERVLFGGADLACSNEVAKKKVGDPEPDPDFE